MGDEGLMLEYVATHYSSGLFTIFGVIVSGILLVIANWGQSRLEAQHRVAEKLLDRRLFAHEVVIQFALSMRAMNNLGYVDEMGELARYPAVLTSDRTLRDWYEQFVNAMGPQSTWLTTEVTREMNFIQDYALTLFSILQDVPEEEYPKVGLLVRQDFIDSSSRLEQTSRKYLTKQLPKLTLNDLGGWHKYPKDETERRLLSTQLMQRKADIQDLGCRQKS